MTAVSNDCLRGLLVDPRGEVAEDFAAHFHDRSVEVLEASTTDPAELWLPPDCDFALVVDTGPEATRHALCALRDQDGRLPIIVAGLRKVEDAVKAVNGGATRIYGEQVDFADLAAFLDTLVVPRRAGRPKKSAADDGSVEAVEPVHPVPAFARPAPPPFVIPELTAMALADQERVLTAAFHALDASFAAGEATLLSTMGSAVFRELALLYAAWSGVSERAVKMWTPAELKSVDALESALTAIGGRDPQVRFTAFADWQSLPVSTREVIAQAYCRRVASAEEIPGPHMLLGHCEPPDDWTVLRFAHQQFFPGNCPITLPHMPPFGA